MSASVHGEAQVEALDYQGRGVARVGGKALFIAGALPKERVSFRIVREKKRFAEAETVAVLTPCAARVTPHCAHYARCGGCDLQHADSDWQVQAKQRLWLEQLARLGNVQPQAVLPPLSGSPWHYRRRARLSVAYVRDAVLLGYKARQSHHVVDVQRCAVLDTQVSAVFPALRALLQQLLPLRVSEVSLSVGDAALAVGLTGKQWPQQATAVVTAWLADRPPHWQVWVNGGCIAPVQPEALTFTPFADTQLAFTPDDFTQVNAAMNRAMVAQARRLLAVDAGARVLDLFCGLGNFAVPLAQHGAQVLALEGVMAMVQRLRHTAQALGLEARLDAQRADLFALKEKDMRRWGKADAWLLDPPRAGAQALLSAAPKAILPPRLLYVSCNPATLARDAAILCNRGYHAAQGGIINMFPQTAHVESMVLFTR